MLLREVRRLCSFFIRVVCGESMIMSAIRRLALRWLLLLLALLLFGPLYLLVVVLAKDNEPFAKRDVVLCVQVDKSALS